MEFEVKKIKTKKNKIQFFLTFASCITLTPPLYHALVLAYYVEIANLH